jgi:3-oxoadipate enol-lactonase
VPFAEIGGHPFFYERQGTGARLLLIGGTGGDLRRPETRFAGPLARHFEVLSYDQRGLGQSWKGSEGRPFAMADYADDAARLMEHLGWMDAHVVGISFGGMVAQELVLRHPGRVRQLILCCTASGGAGGSSFAYHELPKMEAHELAALKVKISDLRRDDAWIRDNPGPWKMLLAMALADPFQGEPGHVEGAAHQIVARATHDTWDRLPAVITPVVVMGGHYDGIAKPEVVRALAGRIPGASLRFFEGGHLFMLEDHSTYDAMLDFLRA